MDEICGMIYNSAIGQLTEKRKQFREHCDGRVPYAA